jgi:hypothetical protein
VRTIADAAESAQNWLAATSALGEASAGLELLGKPTGELSNTRILTS